MSRLSESSHGRCIQSTRFIRSYASSHAPLGTAGRETILGSRAASGPEELRDSERTYASTHAYLGTAGRGTRKGTVGCERAA